MEKILQLEQVVEIDGKTFKLIGIDSYVLKNIYEQNREWLSYTMVNIADKEDRIWLGHGFADNYLIKQWIIPEEEFKKNTEKLPLNADLTGVAHITFEGAQGYSVPNSEIIFFNSAHEDYDFFVIERFLEMDGDTTTTSKSYYHGMRILKDIKL